ncbi:TetR/AcrR family transcriptional regulator [Streptomyces sp. P6-2-1]|uniref:TetR/AcrR family transcriptional regulator n=1 Tax=unclassified Streptomyces TaxID=2593676 RepID=UPI003D3662BE
MTGEPEQDATGRKPVRRPRLTPARESEFLRATLDVLRTAGYEALSMEAVAARAQCSKATLYRLHGTKQRLVAAAVSSQRPHRDTPLDTGSLRGDLLAHAQRDAAAVEDSAAVFWAVAHASLHDAELRAALHTVFIDPETAELDAAVERAVARGELPRRPAAAAHIGRLAFGSVLARSLEGQIPPTYLASLVDEVLLPALRHS